MKAYSPELNLGLIKFYTLSLGSNLANIFHWKAEVLKNYIVFSNLFAPLPFKKYLLSSATQKFSIACHFYPFVDVIDMIISCCDQILEVFVHLKHERFFFYYLLDILQALPGHPWAVSQRSVTLYIFGLVHLLNNLLQVCSHFVHFLNKIPLPLIQFLPHLVALFFRHLISPLFIRVIDACDSINDI